MSTAGEFPKKLQKPLLAKSVHYSSLFFISQPRLNVFLKFESTVHLVSSVDYLHPFSWGFSPGCCRHLVRMFIFSRPYVVVILLLRRLSCSEGRLHLPLFLMARISTVELSSL
ncbi:uncharacterized protein LOC107849965 [Capsicum annuum]|uniref:uncharacterized protein LOC107849965 n=1 Tax=Capsicum annuum TaxID=4072 RepID=UPI001FB0F669|nr:uncharacterized protein LOC107849965 [Capsicum annuum]